MMSWAAYLAAAVFLPLFPFSMLFTRLYSGVRNPWLRAFLLVAWPQLGVLAVAALEPGAPSEFFAYWAVLTALLYAFRALALRDLSLWIAYLATSTWALIWPFLLYGVDAQGAVVLAVTSSLPFVLLAWLVVRLETLFGGAYADTYGGLAQTLPRLSLVLVLALLAAVATPMFPGFFVMFATVTRTLAVVPAAAALVLLVWLLWAWAGARMTRGLVVGPADAGARTDLGAGGVAVAVMLLAALGVTGFATSGYLI